MGKSVWKLGKFDKGINSYTDPKDINSDEWVELDDVNVSKVGVAKVLGRPKSDSSVHHPTIGNLIGGNGLYRFTSDNSYMPSIAESSIHILENTLDGGGGSKSTALFGIKSLVWLFTGKPPSDATTTVSFQLKIGGTVIMDAMVCLSGNMAQNTGDTTSTTTNVFDDAIEETTGDLFNSTTAKYTNIPHNLCIYPENSDTGINEVNGWSDVMSNGNGAFESHLFWDGDFLGADHHEENNNLNQNGIPFSATYDSDGYPTGTTDFHTHYMLGFYLWWGYNEDVLAEGGEYWWQEDDFQPANWANSGFIVPHNREDYSSYQNYKKARLSFMSNLIKAINSYSGSGSNDYQAEFDQNGGTVHLTDDADDMIRIECSNEGVMTGDGLITAEITCSAAGGSSTFYTGGINLLTDSDTYGQGYGYEGGFEGPNDELLNDIEVIDSSAGAMVLQGDAGVTSGTASTVQETFRLTIRGNSNSQDTININIEGVGSSVVDGSTSVVANYTTNEAFVNAIKEKIDLLSDYAATTAAEASGYSDLNTPYYTDITSDTAGENGRFNMTIAWVDDASINISSTGVEDEQLCLISKTGTLITEGNSFKSFLTDFRIWSSYATTWVTRYSNSNTSDVMENDSSKYLNWYYTRINDNDPVFYDEGSILRIAEGNFDLLQELDEMIKTENITDTVNNNPEGYMWANPVQWIGYKNISNHFINSDGNISFSYGGAEVRGFFIGKNAKIWSFTESGNIGLSKTNNQGVDGLDDADDIITGENAKMIVSTYKHDSGGGVDWIGTIKIYAVACYDDGSESLPGHKFTTDLTFGDTEGIEDGDTFRMQVLFRPATTVGTKCFNDVRINGIRLYYTHSEENHSTFWNLGKFDFNRGFIKAATVNTVDDTSGNEASYKWERADLAAINTQSGSEDNITVTNKLLGTYGETPSPNAADTIIEYLEMPKTESYEDITGHSVTNDTLSVDYKAACVAGRRAFVGNIRVWNGSFYEYYNDRMVVSPVNSLDIFPYPDNILDLEISDGDKIIALASYGDKVIQFKQYILYIMNISTGIASEFFVEERHKWKGLVNKNHFCYTDEGVFWINERGAWIYDGDELKDLFILDSEEGSQQRIDAIEWSDFISDESLVGYNASSREVIIVKKHTHSTDTDADCFVYSLVVNSWTKGKKKFFSNTNKSMTNFQTTGSLGKLSHFIEETPNSAQDDAEIT